MKKAFWNLSDHSHFSALTDVLTAIIYFSLTGLLTAQIAPPTNGFPSGNATVHFDKMVTLQWNNPEYTAWKCIQIAADPAMPVNQSLYTTILPAVPGPDSHTFDLEQLGLPTIIHRARHFPVQNSGIIMGMVPGIPVNLV